MVNEAIFITGKEADLAMNFLEDFSEPESLTMALDAQGKIIITFNRFDSVLSLTEILQRVNQQASGNTALNVGTLP